jgi:perosamine synthetase
MIRLSDIKVSEETREKVNKLLLEGKIGQSEIIEEFEEAFARWLKVPYCIAVSSGTMADTIALAILKHFNPKKKKVAVPALTFIAQVNAITYNGLTPFFYDEIIRGIPAEELLCVFPVHLLGKPKNFHKECRIPRNVPVVEDSCEAMGSEMLFEKKMVRCGSVGDIGTFSFFPSHTISTGEGGMIATKNQEFMRLAKRLRNHGKVSPNDFHFDVIGFNGKMTSIQAAIGLGMLKEIDRIIWRRRANFFTLGGQEDINKEYISPHAFPLMAKDEADRDILMKKFRDAYVECRNLFSCIPTQEKAYAHLGYKEGRFPVSEDIGRRGLYIPCHQGLSEEQIWRMKSVITSHEKETETKILVS